MLSRFYFCKFNTEVALVICICLIPFIQWPNALDLSPGNMWKSIRNIATGAVFGASCVTLQHVKVTLLVILIGWQVKNLIDVVSAIARTVYFIDPHSFRTQSRIWHLIDIQ
jgi:flagellar biosynthesis protein FliR